tara:strand:+ start:824 stop:1315 length:492 start_codon:yes stop_codon:yes gene_type:complete
MYNWMKKKHIVNLFFILFFFILDRISKFLIINSANEDGQINVALTSFLNLNLIWNDGIAFGLLSFSESFSYNLVTIIILFVIFILLIMLYKAENLSRYALLLILGGAIGNFFDRVFYSAVPDFIDFYFKGFHWFIFNVADIFISLGLFCLIYVELLKKNTEHD